MAGAYAVGLDEEDRIPGLVIRGTDGMCRLEPSRERVLMWTHMQLEGWKKIRCERDIEVSV